MNIALVWAEARHGAIGRDGAMPWHLPEDLAHFKAVTLGTPVIMGRRTWESLPERFRPLPGRRNIVVTRAADSEASARLGAETAASLEVALALVSGDDAVSIIGGGELYRAAMPVASELVVTRIALDVPDADTYAPAIGPEWQLLERSATRRSRSGLEYRFERWRRESDTLDR